MWNVYLEFWIFLAIPSLHLTFLFVKVIAAFFFRKSKFMKKVRIMRYKLKSEFFHLSILFYCVKKKKQLSVSKV